MSVVVSKPRFVSEEEKDFRRAWLAFYKQYEHLHNVECVLTHGTKQIGFIEEFIITVWVLDKNNISASVNAIPSSYEGYNVYFDQWPSSN